REEAALLEDVAPGPLPVLAVLERGERRGLAEAVDVVGCAHAVQAVARLCRRRRVADAEPREPRDFREGSQHDQARIAREKGDAVGILGVALLARYNRKSTR